MSARTPMEQALRMALAELLREADVDATWPPAVTAKRNAEDLLRERITPQAYLQAVTAREVA